MWVDLLPLLFTLPLLGLSGFFSGSETMLFGLSAADRAELRGRHPAVSERIEALTKDSGTDIVLSETVARHIRSTPLKSLGKPQLRGVGRAIEVYTLA